MNTSPAKTRITILFRSIKNLKLNLSAAQDQTRDLPTDGSGPFFSAQAIRRAKSQTAPQPPRNSANMKAQTGTPHRGRKSPSTPAIPLLGTPGSVVTQPTSTPSQSRSPPSVSTVLGRIPARSASRNHSFCNSAKRAPTAALRAIATTHTPETHCGRVSRISSRNRRRTRFLSTAPPTRLEVINPTLVEAHPRITPTVIKRPL